MRFDGPVVEIGQVSQTEDGDLVIETCVTRTLTPALTLEQGLQKINEVVEEFKLNPPSTPSGFHRFQVIKSLFFCFYGLVVKCTLNCEFHRWLCRRVPKP